MDEMDEMLYIDYMMSSPMTDGEEIRAFFEEIREEEAKKKDDEAE